MRIVGGRLRGLKLAELGQGDMAAHLRPTSDRVREAVFNLLINGGFGNAVAGARVLDLFAGTGALGLEALSRGAASVTFVDDGNRARSLIRANIDRARAQEATRLLRRDATRLGDNPDAPYGLIFLDPPYGRDLGTSAILSALQGGWIGAGALIVYEDSRPSPIPAPLNVIDQRRYGESIITLARMGAG